MSAAPDPEQAPLGLTAVYTSQVARAAGLPGAHLFDAGPARVVYGVASVVMALARLFDRRDPPLSTSILHRTTLIDALVARDRATAVLELACGLSRRGIALSADPATQVVEVDLPAVIRARRELLDRTEQGRAVLARENLRMVGADAATADLAGLAPADGPLHVVIEGLFVYLDAEAQRALWRRVQDLLAPRGGTLLFDLLPAVEEPPPGWVGRLLGRLFRRATQGHGFVRDARTRLDIEEELRRIGFTEVQALPTAQVAATFGLPLARRPSRQLVWCCRVPAPGRPDPDNHR
ncbi:class I SAM-dependent methyltransferase [Myxococcota bacterium]|nr:class I SAM-dependent methyltransferase [Myxococcota bacterium]